MRRPASAVCARAVCARREMAALQALRGEEGADGAAAAAAFPVGSLAGASVHEVKDFGLVADLDGHPVRSRAGNRAAGRLPGREGLVHSRTQKRGEG
jgi:hypothetical protein